MFTFILWSCHHHIKILYSSYSRRNNYLIVVVNHITPPCNMITCCSLAPNKPPIIIASDVRYKDGISVPVIFQVWFTVYTTAARCYNCCLIFFFHLCATSFHTCFLQTCTTLWYKPYLYKIHCIKDRDINVMYLHH